jgi:hypothetical protein
MTCGEPYIDENTAKEVEALANAELDGLANRVSTPSGSEVDQSFKFAS